MSGRRWGTRCSLLAVLALVLTSTVALDAGRAASGAPSEEPATTATGTSRAVVVIDSGTQRTATCVRFDEPSIAGLDALRRTGASVVDQAFGPMGGAVCSINGIGCPLTGCLTCQAPAYWNYFRAVGGAGFARSGTGASTAKVRDGDVEGWAWGANPGAPPLPSVDEVCGPRPTPAPGPAPAPASPPASPSAAPPAPQALAPPEGDASGPGDPSTGGLDGATGGTGESTPDGDDGDTTTTTDATTAPGDDPDDGNPSDLQVVDAEAMAAVGSEASEGGLPWPSLVAFAVLVAGLGTWAIVVRRRRSLPE